MRCNCENLKCQVCKGNGCGNPAGAQKAMYVGDLCDPCAEYMPKEYLLPADYETCGECGFDHQYEAQQANDMHRAFQKGEELIKSRNLAHTILPGEACGSEEACDCYPQDT